MEPSATISEDYLRQQKELHKNPGYGVASIGFAPIVQQLIAQFGSRSLADYGAGKCNLKRKLDELGATGFEYFPYDPAFPEYGPPREADLKPRQARIDLLGKDQVDLGKAILGEEMNRVDHARARARRGSHWGRHDPMGPVGGALLVGDRSAQRGDRSRARRRPGGA